MQCCAAGRATCRNQQTPQVWMEGSGMGVDCFVLVRYPIFWGQWLNNNYFGTNCRFCLNFTGYHLLLYTFNHIFVESACYKINLLLFNFFSNHCYLESLNQFVSKLSIIIWKLRDLMFLIVCAWLFLFCFFKTVSWLGSRSKFFRSWRRWAILSPWSQSKR